MSGGPPKTGANWPYVLGAAVVCVSSYLGWYWPLFAALGLFAALLVALLIATLISNHGE